MTKKLFYYSGQLSKVARRFLHGWRNRRGETERSFAKRAKICYNKEVQKFSILTITDRWQSVHEVSYREETDRKEDVIVRLFYQS